MADNCLTQLVAGDGSAEAAAMATATPSGPRQQQQQQDRGGGGEGQRPAGKGLQLLQKLWAYGNKVRCAMCALLCCAVLS